MRFTFHSAMLIMISAATAAAAADVAGRLSSLRRHGILRRHRRSRKYTQYL